LKLHKESLMNTYNLPTDKIPEHVREIVLTMQEVLAAKAYDFLLIGATARNLIMDSWYDLGPGQITMDVDFAIYVPEWESYHLTLSKLVKSGKFSTTPIQHRLCYLPNIEVDIVPFGAIQDETGNYHWPPDFISGMNVAGFMEINEQGIMVESPNKNLRFRVAPIHGICIMKFFAWKDRKYKTDKDAKDLAFILANYLDLKKDLLYDKYMDIATDENYDAISSAGRVLGRDITEILFTNPVVLNQVRAIIQDELSDEDECLLARTMASSSHYNYEKAYATLKNILVGIDDPNLSS